MTGVSRDLLNRFANELPPLVFALLFIVPLFVCFTAHPSMKFLLFMACAFPAILFAMRRLRAHGEMFYVGVYLALLYLLLVPGLIGEAKPRYFLFYYSLSLLLFSPLVFFRKAYPVAKAFCVLALLLVLSVNLVFTAYALRAGALLDSAGLRAIYQTDVAEAVGYIEAFIGPTVVLGVALALVALLLLLARLRPPSIRAVSLRWQLVVMAGALALAWETRASSNEFQLYSTVWGYRDMLQDYREVSAGRQTDFREIDATLVREKPETHVVVIGESSTRNHMDIYGYFRPTTPNFRRIKDELIVFTDVISNHSHTMEVLEKALTLADQDNNLDYSHAEAYSLIELLKASGVTTYWLSNQNRLGLWDNIVTIIGEGADHVTFVSDRIGEDYDASPDENLLLPFREALEDDTGTKVIFVHLMGTHAPYHRRYPPDFARFAGSLPAAAFGSWQDKGWITDWFRTRDDAKRVNEYDNAMLYTDRVLYQLIEILKEHESAASLLYFSDHGESPIEGTGHDSALFSRSHVEIPLVFWFSKEFKQASRDLVLDLAANRHKKVMTDTLEHTVLDLVGVDVSYLDVQKSLFRPTFVEQDRRTLNGAIDYDEHDDPLLNAKRNMQEIGARRPSLHPKIWAHRANSLGKLSEVIGVFPGAELDLVMNDVTKRLEIRHPPVTHTGLDLDEVLRFLKANEADTRLWLDFKNLEEDNLYDVLARLSDLDERYGLKDRVIIETTYTGKGFDQFVEQDFYTSYYLPTDEVLSAMETGDADQLERLAGELADIVRRHRARAISFDIRLYDFVRKYLARFAAMHGLDYLTWDLTVSSSENGFAQEICERDLDERIKVVLVPFSSRFGI